MIKWLTLAAVAVSSSGCGLIIDGAYLISDKRSHRQVEQRKPTGEAETRPERRIAFEGQQLRVVCEDVTRGVDRVWTVEKDYEYQGGFYQAHWLPVILEGAIGGGLAIGIGLRCPDPTAKISCDLLYGTIPFGVDVIWSLARLLMIDPPKLVDKHATPPHTEPSNGAPENRTEVACDSNTVIVANDVSVPGGGLQIGIGPGGWLRAEDQQRLLGYAYSNHGTQVSLYAGNRQTSVDQGRCEFFKALNATNPVQAIPVDCQPQPAR